MPKKSDRDEVGLESPIPFRPGSNGEYVPPPPTERDRRAEALFRRVVDERARRLGVSRREFIQSASGAAAALMVINSVYGCGGGGGGGGGADAGYAIDAAMTWDAGQACEALGGDEFILDVQTHHINPDGAWRALSPGYVAFFQTLPQASCGEADKLDCFDAEHYVREMFVNSDTTVAVLSAVPAEPDRNPLTADEQAATRELVDALAQSSRLLIHGMVLPDRGAPQLDGMQRLVEELRIAAWKVYTPYGGWRLDSEAVGRPFIEKARQLGVKVICAHKGLPLPGFDAAYAAPDDVGVVARDYPDVQFVVYHSAFETSVTEGPYDPASPKGVDRLIKAMQDQGLPPNSNVWAELGSTWRFVMTDPTQAAHVLGKLLRHVGEDRVVWGTDSIWYGSPQDQIMALRAFQIPTAMQEMHGYPALTAERKAKIFGLNAAALYGVDPDAVRCAIRDDQLARRRAARRAEPGPRAPNLGPRTRRELFALLRATGGRP